ncbi:MAG: hypothetical protein J6B68_01820 [Lachnospiraceae bacterium]|nr:hypothetical protein [Lachnospiraceae bacterium]MBP3477585.1 hypothetical protein [Lachnospiraceae bacterium]
MNKRQLEVQKAQASDEAQVIKQLKRVYTQARKDCEAKIRELSSRTDMENLQSIVFQKQYQEVLKNQIDAILNTLNNNSFTTIADYLGKSYENGFLGTLYDLQGQGVPLIFPINQEEVVQALQVDSKISQGLYQRMGEDTDNLKKSIKAELSRGAANGESWNQIAAHIANGMNSPFNKAFNRAIGIARTEGHRVTQEATYHCQQRAKTKGADVVKQWDSTLDGATRPTHVELNGQIREIDERFEVAGHSAPYPGAFGIASEDCNCRCCLLQRAKWAVSEEEYCTKWDGNKNELVRINAKNYDKFKEQAKIHLLKTQFPDDVFKINGITDEVKDELETALLKLKSEYDIRLNEILVEKAGKNDIFITGYHDGVVDMVVNEAADFDRIIRNMRKKYKNDFFAGKTLEDYLAHEMAHVMMYQDCTTENEYYAKYQQINSLYGVLKGISGYADKEESGNEALAEAFVRVRNKENVSPIVKVLVESYFGRWKK